jgi:hypothetical protein
VHHARVLSSEAGYRWMWESIIGWEVEVAIVRALVRGTGWELEHWVTEYKVNNDSGLEIVKAFCCTYRLEHAASGECLRYP